MCVNLMKRPWLLGGCLAASLLCGSFVVGWAFAAEPACQNKCHEGWCWSEQAFCYKAAAKTAREAQSLWARTTGGKWRDAGDDIGWDRVQYCTKECHDKDFSRAMKGDNYSESTCSGRVITHGSIDRGWCGS